MKRQPLEKGTQIQLNSVLYIIDDVLGDGATCIVYKAHYADHTGYTHHVYLKECYPYGTQTERVGDELQWNDESERIERLSAFQNAYEKLLNMQNKANLRNSTAHAFDLFEANNTKYSVTDITEGKTFDKDQSTSLSDILKTALALTKVVGKYHANGYLHLDIKPGNFLVIPETRELVVLFDMDTVTAIDDLRSGKVACVSYSKGWAAPEQMQGQLSKICEATDLYSIGAVLFQKITKKDVAPEDCGMFADWDFDGEMFDKVNPKIKRLLRDIFKKTLAANVKRRWQSADELVEALEEACKAADERLFIDSDCPAANTNL